MAIIKLIDEIRMRNGNATVFAEFWENQRLLRKIFLVRFGVIAKIINGETPSLPARNMGEERQTRERSTDAFQAADGFSIIIMSPIAAGMGRSVTATNNVIHCVRHWNPMREKQAAGRARRVGRPGMCPSVDQWLWAGI